MYAPVGLGIANSALSARTIPAVATSVIHQSSVSLRHERKYRYTPMTVQNEIKYGALVSVWMRSAVLIDTNVTMHHSVPRRFDKKVCNN